MKKRIVALLIFLLAIGSLVFIQNIALAEEAQNACQNYSQEAEQSSFIDQHQERLDSATDQIKWEDGLMVITAPDGTFVTSDGPLITLENSKIVTYGGDVGGTIYWGPYQGYKYKINIRVDTSGHNVDSCSKLNGRKHLNIDIDRKYGSGSYVPYSRLHIAQTGACKIVVHDAYRPGWKCKEFNYCFNIGKVGMLIADVLAVYGLYQAVISVIVEYWYLIAAWLLF